MEEENIKKIKYTTNIFREKNSGIEIFRFVVKSGVNANGERENEIFKENLKKFNSFITQIHDRENPNNLEHIVIHEYEDDSIEVINIKPNEDKH